MTAAASTEKKIDELYELIDGIEIAMMTTRRTDGNLVTRPMATQPRDSVADVWFVTDIDTHKVEELLADPHVCLGYYHNSTKDWVSVSGRAAILQDRQAIRELYQSDWKVWFPDEGGNRDGGPDDPRLALILVEANSVVYMKTDKSRPAILFEIAKGYVTGEQPDIGRMEKIEGKDLHR